MHSMHMMRTASSGLCQLCEIGVLNMAMQWWDLLAQTITIVTHAVHHAPLPTLTTIQMKKASSSSLSHVHMEPCTSSNSMIRWTSQDHQFNAGSGIFCSQIPPLGPVAYYHVPVSCLKHSTTVIFVKYFTDHRRGNVFSLSCQHNKDQVSC